MWKERVKKIQKLNDIELNKFSVKFIKKECWHDVDVFRQDNPLECLFCKKFWTLKDIADADYCGNIQRALTLIETLKTSAIEFDKKGIDFEFDYSAFGRYLKECLLLSKNVSNPQPIYYEDIFALYLVKPRQIVEACLLAVNYEKYLTGE